MRIKRIINKFLILTFFSPLYMDILNCHVGYMIEYIYINKEDKKTIHLINRKKKRQYSTMIKK